MRLGVVGLALVGLTRSAHGQDGPYLYVCSQNAAVVSVIDMERNALVATIDLQALGFSANAKPHHAVVEPDGSHWYLSLIGEDRVLKFSRSNELVGHVEFAVPGMLALHPTEDLLLVGRSMSAVNPPQRIGMVRRSDLSIEEVDVFYPRPHALTVHPGGGYGYSASLAENRIGVIDLASHEVELIDLDGPLHTLVQFAFSPDGRWAVAGGQMTGQLLVFDASDPPGLVLMRSIPVNAQPWHPVFTPDGRWVYFGNKEANTVTVIDTRDWSLAKVITDPALAEPHGSAVSPDGRYVYIASNNLKQRYPGELGEIDFPGTVLVIDTATQEVIQGFELPEGAAGLGAPAAR